MPAERGLFLPITWRLAPPLCRATSELFYEGKLSSAVGVDQVRLSGTGRFEGAGVWVVDVPHEGNRNASDEEVDEVVRLIDEIRGPAAEWIDLEGTGSTPSSTRTSSSSRPTTHRSTGWTIASAAPGARFVWAPSTGSKASRPPS